MTLLRNWISGLRASSPPNVGYAPLNTFTQPGGGCGTTAYYGDYLGASRAPITIQAGNYQTNVIGNILGYNGQTLISETSRGGCYANSAFVRFITTTAEFNTETVVGCTSGCGSANTVPTWYIGPYESGAWHFDQTTINTQTLTANWEWWNGTNTTTGGEHCYSPSPGTGGTTDLGCSGVTVPNSFYLALKPLFFGTRTWPWVNSATGTTYTLPAMYCFQHGEMPSCLMSWNGY